MGTIGMNPGEIRAAGNKIVANADTFSNNVKSIYATVNGMLQDKEWAGVSATDFGQEFNSDRVKFENFGTELKNYGSHLLDTSRKYEQVDDELRTQIHQSRGE